ncbi:response regulator [Polaribacter sp. R77954]|uniref:response regulator n=1 Tax=Polaribacter sp. R77954 TaxID=3093870 RepID=UPI0037C89C8D
MKSLSILLIDDDKIERLKFLKVCKKINIHNAIWEAPNGAIALDILQKKNFTFDLIISDINMPKMDGFEFLKSLKTYQESKLIPVVMMSTSENIEDLERCYKLGISGYFSKPLKYKEYLSKVTSLLEYWGKANLA